MGAYIIARKKFRETYLMSRIKCFYNKEQREYKCCLFLDIKFKENLPHIVEHFIINFIELSLIEKNMINVEFLGKTNFTYITIEMSSCSFEEMHYAIKVLQKLFSSKICYFLYSKIAMNALDNAKCEIVEEININMKQTEETIKINNFLEESITYHPIGKIEEVDLIELLDILNFILSNIIEIKFVLILKNSLEFNCIKEDLNKISLFLENIKYRYYLKNSNYNGIEFYLKKENIINKKSELIQLILEYIYIYRLNFCLKNMPYNTEDFKLSIQLKRLLKDYTYTVFRLETNEKKSNWINKRLLKIFDNRINLEEVNIAKESIEEDLLLDYSSLQLLYNQTLNTYKFNEIFISNKNSCKYYKKIKNIKLNEIDSYHKKLLKELKIIVYI